MKLVALLSWYDEPCSWLAELVGGLYAAGVDHIVAVDGAYELYPGARATTGTEQAHTVVSAATALRMGVTVHVPAEPWPGNEVEKRSFLFAAGHAVVEPGTDWLVVVDADEVWTEARGLKDALVAIPTPVDVAEVLLRDGDGTTPIRKCFRAQTQGIHVVGHHARYVTDYGDVLWDAARVWEQGDAESLWDFKVRHRPAARDATRSAGRAAYYQDRAVLKAEG